MSLPWVFKLPIEPARQCPCGTIQIGQGTHILSLLIPPAYRNTQFDGVSLLGVTLSPTTCVSVLAVYISLSRSVQ
ncbi:hypothetical protein BD311DRAFT_767016 [Dichomitus squalens]|uniref:Uncharacterized protein n=1 Tax=Dichomitus squalens TaxID=114155 RepID=A0A4Q9MCE8_9APHY|nr:hypothetical protein BD311DRAFT_767016 [Dichomitus squalens]